MILKLDVNEVAPRSKLPSEPLDLNSWIDPNKKCRTQLHDSNVDLLAMYLLKALDWVIWKVRQIVLIVIFHVQESSRYGALLCVFSTYSWKRLVFLVSWSFLQRHLWLWRRTRWRRILDWPWENWKSFKSLLWHDQSRWWVLVFYSYHWKDLHPQIRL